MGGWWVEVEGERGGQRNKEAGAEAAWVGCRHVVRDKDKGSGGRKGLG
jgi:hypothetical protein